MQRINSKITGKTLPLYEMERLMKPIGYSIGGNWGYDHGYFDYKMADEPGYVYLRVPFQAVQGALNHEGVVVRVGTPFILAHQYEDEVDEGASSGVLATVFNQFAEPVDRDAEILLQYGVLGKALVEELEFYLL
ncbi:MAG: YugN family protein [Bacillus sp. (in: firmicutes)]